MPFSIEDDGSKAYVVVDSDLDRYDEIYLGDTEIPEEGRKVQICITSNDDVLHLPSLLIGIKENLINIMEEKDARQITNDIKEAILKDDKLTTQRWQFSVPLEGPEFNGLIIQVYPTWNSWKHLREKK